MLLVDFIISELFQDLSLTEYLTSRSNLASLLKDCQVLAPPAIFLAMAILSQFVQRSQKLADEKPGEALFKFFASHCIFTDFLQIIE